MPSVVAAIESEKQELLPTEEGSRWKRAGCCTNLADQPLKAYLVDRVDGTERTVYRMEFGGGAVTVAHPYLSVMPDHYQDNQALFRISGRADVKLKFYGDSAKQEIWLHADPGVNEFPEVLTLENLTLDADGVFRNIAGDIVGLVPTPVIRAINTDSGKVTTSTGTVSVEPQEDGNHILLVAVDRAWMVERFAAGDVLVVDPTVSTSTSASATATPNQRKSDRFPANGNGLLDMYVDGINNLNFRYSLDAFATTPSTPTGSQIAGVSNASMFIDPDGYIHLVSKNSGNGSWGYRRGTPTFDTSNNLTSISWVGGNISTEDYPDIVVHREGTGWKAHVVSSWTGSGDAVYYRCINIAADGTTTTSGATTITTTGFASHMYPSIAIDASKNLYVTWTTFQAGAGYGVRAKKGTYSAGSWTWGAEEAVTESYYAPNTTNGYMGPCWIDSQGRVVVTFSDAANFRVYRRSTGGTWTDLTPASNAGTRPTLAIDASDNIYLWYLNSGLFRRKYDGTTWSSAVTVDATTTAAYPSARRDSAGNALDVVYQTGSASPYNVLHDRLVLNSAPYAAILTVSAAFPALEGVTITLTHNDPDGDSGGAYRLKRVKTSDGTTNYWNGSAWVGAQFDNEAAGPTYTISAAANAGTWTSGETYTLYGATRDTSNVWGSYSTGTPVTAGTRPVAGLTSPGATVTSGSVTAQGTSTQSVSAYHYELLNGTGSSVIEDGGWQNGTSIPPKTFAYVLSNNTNYQIRFMVRNTTGSGIDSPSSTQPFTTSFTPPPATPAPTLTEDRRIAAIVVEWPVDAYIAWLSVWQPFRTAATFAIERTVDGVNWSRRATVDMPLGLSTRVSWTDYTVASGQSYQYRIVAIGDNGLETIGSISDPITAGFVIPWLIHPTDPTQNIPLPLTANELMVTYPQSRTETETLGGARKVISNGEILGAEGELTIVANHRNVKTADLGPRLKAARKLATTWLLKLPMAPGAASNAPKGRLFEVSLGQLREVVSPSKTVISLPFVEVGDELA